MVLILKLKKLMLKNLEDKFNLYCNSKNLEINQNQIIVIRKLQDYYKKILNHFFLIFFSKENLKKVFIFMEMLVLVKQ